MGTRGRKQNPNWFHCFWMKKEKDAQRRHATGAKGGAYDEIVAVPPCAVSLSAICRE